MVMSGVLKTFLYVILGLFILLFLLSLLFPRMIIWRKYTAYPSLSKDVKPSNVLKIYNIKVLDPSGAKALYATLFDDQGKVISSVQVPIVDGRLQPEHLSGLGGDQMKVGSFLGRNDYLAIDIGGTAGGVKFSKFIVEVQTGGAELNVEAM